MIGKVCVTCLCYFETTRCLKKFCTESCRNKWIKKNPKILKKICLFCNKNLDVIKKARKFCDRSCSGKWHHKNRPNYNKIFDPRPKSGKILNCNFCNKEYYCIISRLGKSKYCSLSCSAQWNQKNNPKLKKSLDGLRTREAREKIAAKTLGKSRCWGVKYMPYIDKKNRKHNLKSSWEIAFVEQYLDKLNIEWQYEPKTFRLEHPYFCYTPDFFINEKEWVEIKGDVTTECIEKIEQIKKLYGITIKLVTKKELEKDYSIDLSGKSTNKIMKQWRIY